MNNKNKVSTFFREYKELLVVFMQFSAIVVGAILLWQSRFFENQKSKIELDKYKLEEERVAINQSIDSLNLEFDLMSTSLNDSLEALRDSAFYLENQIDRTIDSLVYYRDEFLGARKASAKMKKSIKLLIANSGLSEKDLLILKSEGRSGTMFDIVDYLEKKVSPCVLNFPRTRLNMRVANYSECRGCINWAPYTWAKVGDTISFSITVRNFSDSYCYGARINIRTEIDSNVIIATSLLSAVNSMNFPSGGTMVFVERYDDSPIAVELIPSGSILYWDNRRVSNGPDFVNSIGNDFFVPDSSDQSSWLELNELPVNLDAIMVFWYRVVEA